jgi:hypothetical protein
MPVLSWQTHDFFKLTPQRPKGVIFVTAGEQSVACGTLTCKLLPVRAEQNSLNRDCSAFQAGDSEEVHSAGNASLACGYEN